MTISLTALIVWIIVGALAGTAAAGVLGQRTRGNLLVNTLVGMVGALVGGFLFDVLQIQVGTLASVQINAQQLLAAFLGAVLLLLVVRAVRR